MWDGRLGTVSASKHRIDLVPGAKPVFQPPYRAGPRQRELEKMEIDKMLEADVIEPSTSEWAAPIVFAPKKDGSLRFYVDYRRLNAVTIRDSYPIQRIDECIDSLGSAEIFSTLDCNWGYWQIGIDECDRHKSAFTSHRGLFQYKRRPFGLRNAPGTFQRTIDIILATSKWQYAIIYLDDIIIFSRNVKEHFEYTKSVLQMLSAAGMSSKLKKCFFLQDRVDYFGQVVSPENFQSLVRLATQCKK